MTPKYPNRQWAGKGDGQLIGKGKAGKAAIALLLTLIVLASVLALSHQTTTVAAKGKWNAVMPAGNYEDVMVQLFMMWVGWEFKTVRRDMLGVATVTAEDVRTTSDYTFDIGQPLKPPITLHLEAKNVRLESTMPLLLPISIAADEVEADIEITEPNSLGEYGVVTAELKGNVKFHVPSIPKGGGPWGLVFPGCDYEGKELIATITLIEPVYDLTLSAYEVTVPQDGSATVEVTVTNRTDASGMLLLQTESDSGVTTYFTPNDRGQPGSWEGPKPLTRTLHILLDPSVPPGYTAKVRVFALSTVLGWTALGTPGIEAEATVIVTVI